MNPIYNLFDSDKDIFIKLGASFKAMRLNKGITQEDLATGVGVSRITITKVESGNNYRMDVFLKLLRFYNKLDVLNPLQTSRELSIYDQLELEKKQRKYGKSNRKNLG